MNAATFFGRLGFHDEVCMTWGPFDLTGKAVVVTGSARGIGLACARRCREAGADVLMADLNGDGLTLAMRLLLEETAPGRLASCTVDVGDVEAPNRIVQSCVDAFGALDVLVNNAGVYPAVDFLEMSADHVREVLRVNVEGLILTTRDAARQMIAQGTGGAVVNIASVGALRGLHPGLVAYGASKGAVISFTRRAAGALGTESIRVNAIAPGAVDPTRAVRPSGSTPVADDPLIAGAATVPLQRVGVPDDIATVAVFLASDAARYVTGQTLIVDGGGMVV